MWNSIAVTLKVNHLRERYSEVLADVVLPDNKIDLAEESTTDSYSFLPSSTQSQSTGFTDLTSQGLSSPSSQVLLEGQSGRGIAL
jgi:hypothetical protein